jgi:hypothetical protein
MTLDERNLDQAWDEFLQLDAVQRETHVPASDDEVLMRDLHAQYRPEAARAEFRERLLQSIPEVVERPDTPASRRVSAVSAAGRRKDWRNAPAWGYLTMALIVGLLAIAAGYTYMQTGDDPVPTEEGRSLANGTPGATDQPIMANVTTVSGQLGVPVNADDRSVVFSLVTLPPGETYTSSAAGTELAFAEGGAVTFVAATADKHSAISPFVVSNPGTSEASFVLVSATGDGSPNEVLDNGATIVELTDKPIPMESATNVAIEVIFGSGSGAVPTSAVSGTTFLTTEDGPLSVSSGGSGVVADATSEGFRIGSGELAVIESSGEVTVIESSTDSPWIMFSVSPAGEAGFATPVFGTPVTVP